MSEALRADITLWVGVLISVVGAVVATPAGTAFAASSVAKALRRPFRQNAVIATTMGSAAALAGSASMTATGTVGPARTLTLEERLDMLVVQLDDVRDRVDATSARLESELSRLTSELADTADALTDDVDALRRRMIAAEEEAARIDGRALPVIVAGIVVSAAAGALSQLPVWLWALLTLGAVCGSLVLAAVGVRRREARR